MGSKGELYLASILTGRGTKGQSVNGYRKAMLADSASIARSCGLHGCQNDFTPRGSIVPQHWYRVLLG